MDSNRVQYIDVWRFFAVALVIVSHLFEFSHPFYAEKFPGLIWRMHAMGQLGVYVFFCISGYVICRGMLHEARKYGSFSMRGFYIRRAFRIFPPFLLYLSFLALMAYQGIYEISPGQFAQSAAFACNIETVSGCSWYLGHTWSLAFEEQFYLFFPLIFICAGLARHHSRILFILSLLVGSALFSFFLSQKLSYFLSIFCFMVWGCMCSIYSHRIHPALARMPLAVWFALCGLLLCINLVSLPPIFRDLIYPLLAPPLICIIVFGTPVHHSWVRKIFENSYLAYLGKISYTVYLWQQLATLDYGFASPLIAVGMVVLVFGFAHLSFRYFELPLVRLGKKISSRQAIPADDLTQHSKSLIKFL